MRTGAKLVTDPHHRRLCRREVEFHVATEKITRIKQTQHKIRICHGRIESAAPVTRRPRFRTGAFGADFEQPQIVDMRDAAAAGTDLDHVNRWNRNRHAAAFLEAVLAISLEHAGDQRFSILNQAGLGGSAAHVE